jgi:hypothetical protein
VEMLRGILKTAMKMKLNSVVSKIGMVAIMVDFKLLNIENRRIMISPNETIRL